MPAYCFVIQAHPTAAADPEGRIGGAIVHVWIVDSDLTRAKKRALAQITELDWVVDAIKHHFRPTPAQLKELHKDERRNYERARIYGTSVEFIGWAKDKPVIAADSLESDAPKSFVVSERLWRERQARVSRLQSAVRQRFSAKHCVYPCATSRGCNGKIVRAHTVQRTSLQRIARRGHVYRISADLRMRERSGGLLSAELVGVKKASTFTGLCARHDNQVFAPLEKIPFRGDAEQCCLLAYRAVLRELYAKRLASRPLREFEELIEGGSEPAKSKWRRFYKSYIKGATRGLDAIEWHKDQLDQVLGTSSFLDTRFVVCRFLKVPSVLISSAWFPTSDFDGNILPNMRSLGRAGCRPDLLTLSILATATGGAAILAWNASSDAACNQFAASLIGHRAELTAHLVRLAFQTSENIYLNPDWWESLPINSRQSLMERSASGFDLTDPFTAGDLVGDGLEVGSWQPNSITVRVSSEGGLLEHTQPCDGVG